MRRVLLALLMGAACFSEEQDPMSTTTTTTTTSGSASGTDGSGGTSSSGGSEGTVGSTSDASSSSTSDSPDVGMDVGGPEPGPWFTPCDPAGDCPLPFICVAQNTGGACTGDADCPGSFCHYNGCAVASFCSLPCTEDEQCGLPAGFDGSSYCSNSACWLDCTSGPCPAGMVCDYDTCRWPIP